MVRSQKILTEKSKIPYCIFQGKLAQQGFCLGFGSARRLCRGIAGGIRGGFRLRGSFVSPRERIGRLRIRLVKSESRVQDDRRTSRPTGKSL